MAKTSDNECITIWAIWQNYVTNYPAIAIICFDGPYAEVSGNRHG